jgi:serine/threonine protein kinase
MPSDASTLTTQDVPMSEVSGATVLATAPSPAAAAAAPAPSAADAVAQVLFPARPDMYEILLIQEFSDLGTLDYSILSGRFHKGPGRPVMIKILLTLYDICQGMIHLRKHDLVHGDLTSNNVLLFTRADNPKGFQAKISDFGLTKRVANSNIKSYAALRTNTLGTLHFM